MGKNDKANKKQHYIPQFYLRHFSIMDQLFVFNIPERKKYLSNVKDCGCQRFFYDIDPHIFQAFTRDDIRTKTIIDDLIMHNSEDLSAPLISEFELMAELLMRIMNCKSVNVDGVEIEERTINEIIKYIVLQFVRTPKFRANFNDLAIFFSNMLSQYSLPFPKNAEFWKQLTHNIFIYSVLSLFASESGIILDDRLNNIYRVQINDISRFLKQLLHAGWILFVSSGEKSFLTSDNPVSIQWSEKYLESFSFVYFPITKNIACMFFDVDKCPQILHFNHQIYTINNDNNDVLDNLNMFLADKADYRLFSAIDDFYKITKFVDKEITCKIVL